MKSGVGITLAIALATNTLAQEIGKPAPAIKFEHSLQVPATKKITWPDLRGKAVVLEFWATWCTPCVQAIPHLNKLGEELADEPVCFISVTDEPLKRIAKFLKKRTMKSWVALDTDRSVFKGYGVRGIPRTFVIDKEGRVVLDTRPEALTAKLLREIVGGTYVPTPSTPAKPADGGAGLPELGSFTGGIDPLMWPWIEAGQIEADFFYQTIIRPTVAPGSFSHGTRTYRGGSVGITIISATTFDVLKMALRLPSSLRLVDAAGIDAEIHWDVVFSRPSGSTLEQAWKEIVETMCEVAGVRTEKFRAKRDVLLVSVGEEVLRGANIDWEGDPTVKSFRSVANLIGSLESRSGIIVLSASEDLTKRYVDAFGVVTWRMSAEELRTWLEEKGLSFTRDNRDVDLIRIVRD